MSKEPQASTAPEISEQQKQRIAESENALRLAMYNWSVSQDGADKMTVGDLKKLTLSLLGFARALALEHYGHGLRDGAEVAKKEMATANASDGGILPTMPAVEGLAEAMKVVKDANGSARRGRRE